MYPRISLGWFLSTPMLLFLCTLSMTPVMWSLAASYEGKMFPVVENVEISELGKHHLGMGIAVSFDKVRTCEFLGISWFDQIGNRMQVAFAPDEIHSPITRPVLDRQDAGPWYVVGMEKLEGTVAIVSHKCHPLWTTFTKFYP